MTTNRVSLSLAHVLAPLLALAVAPPPAPAQMQQGTEVRAAAFRTRVHLSSFRTVGSGGQIADIARLVTEMLQLELLRLPIELDVDVGTPVCGRGALGGLNSKSDLGAQTGRYDYVIMGEVRSTADQFQTHYDVWQCQDSARKQVVHELRTIPWKNALSDLVGATRSTSDQIRELLPKVQVKIENFRVVGGSLSSRQDLAEAAKNEIAEELYNTQDLQPNDSAGEYVVRGELHIPSLRERVLPGSDATLAKIEILRNGSIVPLNYFQLTSKSDSTAKFLALIARTTVEKLDQIRFAPALGFVRLDSLSTPDLIARAQEALCIDVVNATCTENPDGALTALRIVTQRDTTSFTAYMLLGEVATYAGERPRAIDAYLRAARLAQRARLAGRAVKDSSEIRVLNGLGDAYYSAGNYVDADRYYARSLLLDGMQVQAIIGRAKALRETKQRVRAAQLIATRLRQGRLDDSTTAHLVDEFGESFESMKPETLVDSITTIVAICGQVQLSKTCGNVMMTAAKNLYDTGSDAERVRDILRHVTALQGAEAMDVSSAWAYLALLDVKDRWHRGADEMYEVTFPAFNADSTDAYLRRAEDAARGLNDRSHNDWLRRLRSRYWFALGNKDEALRAADEANRIYPNDQAAFLAAEVVFYRAIDFRRRADSATTDKEAARKAAIAEMEAASKRLSALVLGGYSYAYSYFAEASHVLRIDTRDKSWDVEARNVFQTAVKKDSTNNYLMSLLSLVCLEYLTDFDCNYRWSYQRPFALGLARTVDDSLNASEAVVLYGNYEAARRILSALPESSLDACRTSVRRLYIMWIAAANGQRDQADAAYSSWRTAAQKYRASSEDECWIFQGAGARIKQMTFDPVYRQRLADMMIATEHKTAPMPQ